jgi:prepilin peptidase CpaA
MAIDSVRFILFPALMAWAASSDLLTMTISNRISIVLIVGFFALAALGGMGGMDMLAHLGAGTLVLVVSFGFFLCGWIGGGDAKLAAATALWFGFDYLLVYLVYASILGGVLTLMLLQFRNLPLPQPLARQGWVQRLHEKDGGIPYGIALAAAAMLVYPQTPWMAAIAL